MYMYFTQNLGPQKLVKKLSSRQTFDEPNPSPRWWRKRQAFDDPKNHVVKNLSKSRPFDDFLTIFWQTFDNFLTTWFSGSSKACLFRHQRGDGFGSSKICQLDNTALSINCQIDNFLYWFFACGLSSVSVKHHPQSIIFSQQQMGGHQTFLTCLQNIHHNHTDNE